MDTSPFGSFVVLGGIAVTIGGIALTLLFQGFAWRQAKKTNRLGNEAIGVGAFLGVLALIQMGYAAWEYERLKGILVFALFILAFVLLATLVPRLRRR
jgi:type IV secretory pathway TrbL component